MANKHQRIIRHEEHQEHIRAAGGQAYLAGVEISDNPFKPASEDALCWDEGWQSAARRNPDAPPIGFELAEGTEYGQA